MFYFIDATCCSGFNFFKIYFNKDFLYCDHDLRKEIEISENK